MSRVYGEAPRPWVLAYGFTPADQLGHIASELFKTVFYVDGSRIPGSQVRESDYDLVLCNGGLLWEPAENLHVLQFGDEGSGEVENHVSNNVRYQAMYDGLAGRLSGPGSDVPDAAIGLAAGSLAAWLLQTVPRPTIALRFQNGMKSQADPAGVCAFVREENGLPCSGVWQRGKSSRQWWWLPQNCPDQRAWVIAAYNSLAAVDGDAFPALTEAWREMPAWMTPGEVVASEGLAEKRQEMEATLSRFRLELVELEDRISQERQSAEAGPRRLLTAQGEDLKIASMDAFKELGFDVLDSDVERLANQEALLEDLQVSEGDFTAIVEVRGYSKSGGKTSDLLRIGRAASAYQKVNGCLPSARWYVVNHSIQDAPDDRPNLLQGAESDVEEFALAEGLMIDSRDLFSAIKRADGDTDMKESIRHQLQIQRGRFNVNAVEADQAEETSTDGSGS